MKLLPLSILLLLLFNQCATKNAIDKSADAIEYKGYYSDYFVFVADDGGSPLVIPIDINWTLHEEGYEREYKSWYGTEENWPIEYFKKNIAAKTSAIPYESFEHPDTESFHFDKGSRSIVAKIKGKHETKIQIPAKEEWVLSTLESDFPTYVFKTTITTDGESRSGWMLYERIRLSELRKFEGFEAFYWMPIVSNGSLYHFTQHRGEQTAVRWSTENDLIEAETVPTFVFKIIDTISDAQSKRTAIAKTVQLQVPEWELDIILNSTGEQVGYGGQFSKGLAYFRQSLLQSSKQSSSVGYGMMELILADD